MVEYTKLEPETPVFPPLQAAVATQQWQHRWFMNGFKFLFWTFREFDILWRDIKLLNIFSST